MTSSPTSTEKSSLVWTTAATLIALIGAAGSLWLSISMKLKACPLCLYERTFMMSAAALLIVGLTTHLRRSSLLPLLALPAAFAGLIVVGFHVNLERTGKLECPLGILGLGTAPQQSLAVFVVLVAVLLIAQFRSDARRQLLPLSAAILLGLACAWGAIKSAPPPPVPTEAYTVPLDGCRLPFRP